MVFVAHVVAHLTYQRDFFYLTLFQHFQSIHAIRGAMICGDSQLGGVLRARGWWGGISGVAL